MNRTSIYINESLLENKLPFGSNKRVIRADILKNNLFDL